MTSFADILRGGDRDATVRALRGRIDEWMRASFRHDILMARTVRGLQIEAVAAFDRDVIRPLLVAVSSSLPSVALASGDAVSDLFPELSRLRDRIGSIVGAGTATALAATEKQIAEVASEELAWVLRQAERLSGSSFVATPAAALAEKVRASTWLGDTTEAWFRKALEVPTADAVRSWVSTGIKRGLSVDEMVRGLRGTKTQRGLLDKPRYTLQGLVRTAATHATTVARIDGFDAIGVGWWRFWATLDLRISIACASQDGKTYRLGEGPVPPLHINCRSVAMPEDDPNRQPIGKRAALGGQVPAGVVFEDWLAEQSRADQDLWLGKTKAAAWRSGQLKLKDMLGRDLEPLTLKELRRLDRI